MAKLNKYKPYESYTDTSAVWYKQKPAHWECERFKYHFIEKKKKNSTCLPAGAISFGEVIFKNEDNLSQDTKSSYQEVCAGEFLINPLNLNFDLKSLRTALSTIDVVVSTGYIVLQDCGFLHPRFARWLLQQFDVSHMKTLGAGVRQTINYADIGNSLFCRPTFEEQKIIAAFLDYETQKIDKLIEKQQQLIELLKEKRQAVISHAVTKGLNPDVPMKDSGVEWLGEVPEHWMVKPLRYLGDCQNGINIGAEAFGSGYPFVSYGDAYKNRVLPDFGSGLVQSTSEDRKKYSLLAGDVLFTRTSETIEEIGFASACLKTIENACFAGFLIRFRPSSLNLNAEYSKYYFSNQLLRTFFTKEMNLITRASLSQDLLKAMPVVIPPKDEQRKIAELLDDKSKRFEQLQLLGEEQIKCLQERRTALISAAVTGKIDVRDWVALDMQDAEEPQETTA